MTSITVGVHNGNNVLYNELSDRYVLTTTATDPSVQPGQGGQGGQSQNGTTLPGLSTDPSTATHPSVQPSQVGQGGQSQTGTQLPCLSTDPSTSTSAADPSVQPGQGGQGGQLQTGTQLPCLSTDPSTATDPSVQPGQCGQSGQTQTGAQLPGSSMDPSTSTTATDPSVQASQARKTGRSQNITTKGQILFYIEMKDDRNNSYASAIDVAASQDPQIIMAVLFSPNEEKYAVIKKKCCVDRAVASQVVTMKVIAPRPEKSAGLMSIATKVVIQMNAKLRGIPWMIDMPNLGIMTCGFDVCHSTKNKNNSYGAFVSTMDIRKSSRYYSSVQEHVKGQELSNYLTLSVANSLRAYLEEHQCLPERIVFYRDGVGDGQLHQVVNHEVKALVNRLDEIYSSKGSAPPRFAFIVVSKRINTRYFLKGRNPPPGTVVDDIITLPERYDFYLVSQSVFQGTVSPTNYNVIHDTTGFKPEHIQMLSYKMTHMYYNWAGTCRVPAVCQYAHKLAFLVGENIMRAPSTALEKNLYFL
ncbi:protein aubergine-like [Teleopsis dalmanni]|uniref:protein aubergine-like n=1 Tax=Teleopsis dalmanni TaxID=139649 RepID=UPI0018CCA2A4|nr:protein aubergine-like [Teleopsis dalmanni]